MRHTVLALDESRVAHNTASWACANVLAPGDQVHLVMVVQGAAPTAAERPLQLEAHANRVRKQLAACQAGGPADQRGQLSAEQIDVDILQGGAGAAGVGSTLVEFANKCGAELVVLGSRGHSAAASALLSLVGLGSVSSYCLHNLRCPVAVVRGRDADTQVKASRRVLVPVDECDMCRLVLSWAVGSLLRPEDELHIICVAQPVPYPATVAEGDFGAAEFLSKREEFEEAEAEAVSQAEATVELAVQYAREYRMQGGTGPAPRPDQIFYRALPDEGGTADVGEAIVHYARENGADVVVMGARNMGALKRSLMDFVGQGSVSDYVVHHLECPVVVVKEPVSGHHS